MSTNPNIVTVDVRGEICPAPLIKATEAIRAAEEGQEIEVLIDFQPAVLAVTMAALKEGWNIQIRWAGTSEWNVHLTPVK